MTTVNQRIAPSCLSEAGRTLWDAVVVSQPVDDAGAEVLLLACKQSDRAAEARRLLEQSTIVAQDRFGQEKPHPAVAIERQASLACARLLAELLVKDVSTEADPEDDFYK